MMLNTDNPNSAQAVRLYDPARLQVHVDVPLADAGKVSVGQRANIVVGVLPDRTFEGEIARIVPQADIRRNTLQVKVRIADPPTASPGNARAGAFRRAGGKATTSTSQQVSRRRQCCESRPIARRTCG